MKHRGFRNGAIVLGGEVNGLAVIRSLGRLGVPVAAVRVSRRSDPARLSRYLQTSEEVAPDASDDEILAAIADSARRIGERPVVLIPTTDRFSEVLARHETSLGEGIVTCNPARATCEAFLDKWNTAELCRRHGVLIPSTACPKTREELAHVAADIAYPVIVKPRLTFGTGFPGKNAVFRDADALLAFFMEHDVLGRCVIQEIVPSGDGDIIVTAAYSSSIGRVQAIYSGRKIRQYLPDYGATCFGVSERHRELEEASCRFLDGIGYRGFSALEFARSRTDGRAYFIELNTRTYYHNQLFADAGVDLTQIAYLDSVGRDFRSALGVPVQRDGMVWLDFRRDYQSMRLKRRAGAITFIGWLKSITASRSFAVWDPLDPAPFLASCAWRLTGLIRNVAVRFASLFPRATTSSGNK